MSDRRKGAGALIAGFFLLVAGFGLILYEVWVAAATFPLTAYTYLGIALAGLGVAAFAVGFDREVK